MKKPSLLFRIALVACAFLTVLVATPGKAVILVGQLGILDLNANGGINPATGNPWAEGDSYRLVFVTSTTRDALSTDINDYRAPLETPEFQPIGGGSKFWAKNCCISCFFGIAEGRFPTLSALDRRFFGGSAAYPALFHALLIKTL